jgi:N-glycosylase/DNA lyase
MQYIVRENEIEIRGISDFDPLKIFECGQCFRWNPEPDGSWTGVAKGIAASVRSEGGSVFISGSEDDFRNVWYGYFDLGRDYSELRARVSTDPYTSEAAEFGKGIRILAQDRWEALCSFIISQCNNIPRIKKIVESLCRLCGDRIEFRGSELYTFPSAERLAAMEPEDLAPIRSGYRAAYIISAARSVAGGETDLEALSELDCASAVRELRKLPGVGEKVANCAVLYGLRIPTAFPVDVWMKRALKEHYPPDFDPSVFGDCAGVAQQYIFYYIRSSNTSSGH